jgi:hypothetical protein
LARVLWNIWEKEKLSEVQKEISNPITVKKIRSLLAKRISHVKYTPELEFVYEPFDKQLRARKSLEQTLNKLDETYNPEPYEKERQMMSDIEKEFEKRVQQNVNENSQPQSQTHTNQSENEDILNGKGKEADLNDIDLNEREKEDMYFLRKLMNQNKTQELQAGQIPPDVIENVLEQMLTNKQQETKTNKNNKK